MSPTLVTLIEFYRHAVEAAVAVAAPPGAPPCPPGQAILWADAGELEGWLSEGQATEIRRLAARLRFYEERAGGLGSRV
ncbi:MAG TPA: hypothetical protein VFS07_09395 [Gemmatimonadales bacterium]|nr:hypothetical protein [Gemmatimonadales bacterium]